MCPRINLSSFSRCELGMPLLKLLRACLHGGGGPQVGEVTRLPYKFLFYFDHVYMIGGVTRQAGVAFMAKSSKAKHTCFSLCTFPGRLMAEITRNRNGHTLLIDHIWFPKLFRITY